MKKLQIVAALVGCLLVVAANPNVYANVAEDSEGTKSSESSDDTDAGGDTRERPDTPDAGEKTEDESAQQPTADPANLSSVLHAQADALTSCYEKALRNHPELSVKVVVTVKVGLQGEVADLELLSTPDMPPSMETCFAGILRTMEFDPPTGGMVTFKKTFVFRTE